ncbi:uncharacterized protein LOC115891483 [Sitophilus oryzae]|uniref:Uncharacterized protein LOC115891483 n=1 Tax=Sitophilus oryzae TaxID=7048 RepID=A0A6J2YY94_SITOR|nr:uncharacterized protein LOC115891483 [Sitophilus oryzae]
MEDVTKLTKEEFLKFLNCSLRSTSTQEIVVPGPSNSIVTLVKRFGNHGACNVVLDEFSLNNQILRVPLPKVDLQSLSSRQVALRFRLQKTETKRNKSNSIVSRFGRKLKKRELEFNNSSKLRESPRNSILSQKNSIITRRSSLAQETKSLETPRPSPKRSDLNRNIGKYSKFFNKQQTPQNSKIYKPKMEVAKPILRQYERKSLPSSKSQFIIKYTPSESTYYLKFGMVKHPQDGKLKYSFDALVKDIKNMKLPSPTWKIKVVVRSNKISSIIFTNKCVLERTVTFNAKSEYYLVVIENKPAILLGSPGMVVCIEDIEILLNIMHTINAKNPMIYYKK